MVELVETRLVVLGDVVEQIVRADPGKFAVDSFSYVDLGSVDQKRKVIDTEKLVATSEAPSRARQVLKSNDVLVSTVRPNLNGVARVPGRLDGSIASTGFCVLRPRAGQLDPNYLFHWVQSPMFIDGMVRKASGASYPAVSDKIVLGSFIPLPPLEEQRRVAAILDKADELRTKRRRALNQLDVLTHSLFRTMFSGGCYPKVQIGHLTKVGTGGTPSRTSEDNYGGTIPWVKTTEVQMGRIVQTGESITEKGLKSSNCRVFPRDSLIIAMYGQGKTRGQVAQLGIDAATNQACAVILPNTDYNSAFLFEQLKGMYGSLRALGRGGNQANLNLQIVKSFEVVLPPIEVQNQFAAQVSAVERTKERGTAQLMQLDALFASLQHRAFRGEL